jgi:hypothetical protein
MSRSLSSLRLLVVIAAILASNGCMGDPFGPGDEANAVIPAGTKPILDPCSDPANVGTPLCPYRH